MIEDLEVFFSGITPPCWRRGSSLKNYVFQRPSREIFSSPAVGADGTVYVGTCAWRVLAVKRDGTIKWAILTGGEVLSSPAVGADGTLYVGSDDGKLYAIGEAL